MKVKDIISKMVNGAAHVELYSVETGEIFLRTIWYNQIPEEYMNREIETIAVREYEIRLGIL